MDLPTRGPAHGAPNRPRPSTSAQPLQRFIDELASAEGFPARLRAMESVAAEMARLKRARHPVKELQRLAPHVLRATSKVLRFNAEQVSASFLIAASRTLCATDDVLQLLDHHVWPAPVSRKAKRGLYREVAKRSRSHRVRAWLAGKEDSRRDPVVRDILLRSHSVAVLLELLRDPRAVPEPAFPALLDRLSRASRPDAVAVLEARLGVSRAKGRGPCAESPDRRQGTPTVVVKATTLARLLRSDSAATREEMLVLLPLLEVSG
jgi:hypothetical protein